jgi:hypothetical protein
MSFNFTAVKNALKEAGHLVSEGENMLGNTHQGFSGSPGC